MTGLCKGRYPVRMRSSIHTLFRALQAGALGLICSAPVLAQTTAVTGGTLLPIDGPAIEGGVMLVEGGKITAIGAKGTIKVPADATVVDATGKVVMPGLVDTHSHIGGVGAADKSGPLQPGVRVYDSINVRSSGFRRSAR